MTRRLTWVFIIGMALSLSVMLATQEQDAIATLLRHDMSSLVVKIVFAVSAAGLFVVVFRNHLLKALEPILFWGVIAALLVIGYTYRYELRDIGDRVIAEVLPGYVASHGANAEVVRAKSGDFALTATINGAKVAMVLDTGASSVVLSQDAARAIGLPLEVLSYTVNVDTANGRVRAAPVTLDRIVIGGLVERAVPALVTQSAQMKSNLLGMSFLNRLDGWDVRGDKLRMRGQP